MTTSAQAGDEAPVVFALKGVGALGEKTAAALGVMLAPYEERDFSDGEHKLRPLASLHNRDVFILDSLAASTDAPGAESVNDRLIKCAFFIATLRQAGARRTTAVLPYLCYARKDRQTKPHDPITSRYVAQLFEAMGTDAIITVTAHNIAAFQNSFRIPTMHLDVGALFAQHLAPRLRAKKVSVVSPDLGGAKRAEAFRQILEETLGRPVAKAFLDKARSMGVVTGDLFAGDVEGAAALIIDDMIGTGETMIRAASACRSRGVAEVFALATHGLFIGADPKRLADAPIDGFIVTDSLPPRPTLAGTPLAAKLETVSLAGLLGGAIRAAHQGSAVKAD